MKNTKPSMVNKLIRQFAIYTLDPATTIEHLINLNNNITPTTSPVEVLRMLTVGEQEEMEMQHDDDDNGDDDLNVLATP